jgi:hypothetical protein
LGPHRDSPAAAEDPVQLAAWREQYEAITPGDCSIKRDYGSLVRVTFRYMTSRIDLLSAPDPRTFFTNVSFLTFASRIQQLDLTTCKDDDAMESVRLGRLVCGLLQRPAAFRNIASLRCGPLGLNALQRGPAAASCGNGSPVAVFTYQILWLTRVFASRKPSRWMRSTSATVNPNRKKFSKPTSSFISTLAPSSVPMAPCYVARRNWRRQPIHNRASDLRQRRPQHGLITAVSR